MFKNNYVNFLIGIIVGLLLYMIVINITCAVSKIHYERGYIDACKDFYKGKLKYELVSDKNDITEWKKVK